MFHKTSSNPLEFSHASSLSSLPSDCSCDNSLNLVAKWTNGKRCLENMPLFGHELNCMSAGWPGTARNNTVRQGSGRDSMHGCAPLQGPANVLPSPRLACTAS